ncbi:MAG: AMP-binding enzyme, partial [Desulfomonilaceae bacterium]
MYPGRIERILYSHNSILEATIMEVPYYYRVETPVSFVVLKNGMKISEQDLIDCVNRMLPATKSYTIVQRSGNRFDKRRDFCPEIWYVPSN